MASGYCAPGEPAWSGPEQTLAGHHPLGFSVTTRRTANASYEGRRALTPSGGCAGTRQVPKGVGAAKVSRHDCDVDRHADATDPDHPCIVMKCSQAGAGFPLWVVSVNVF